MPFAWRRSSTCAASFVRRRLPLQLLPSPRTGKFLRPPRIRTTPTAPTTTALSLRTRREAMPPHSHRHTVTCPRLLSKVGIFVFPMRHDSLFLAAVCRIFALANIPCPQQICQSLSEQFVVCDVNDNIISLNLSSSGLSGSLPDVFQNLNHLTFLNLANNSLSGPFPDSVCLTYGLAGLKLCTSSDSNCALTSVPLCVADAPNSALPNLQFKEIGNLTNPQKGEHFIRLQVQ